jgi:hypothetical protein
MANAYNRVLASLSNGVNIFAYNSNSDSKLSEAIVLSGLPIISTNDNGDDVYKFNHPDSGWFCSIRVADSERTPNILQMDNEDIVVKLTPLKTYSTKDLAKAKQFIPGGN